MSTTSSILEIHIGRTNHQDQPEHWVLMLRAPGAPKCTFIHSAAESIAYGNYTRSIEYDRYFEHVQIPFRDKRYVIVLLEKLEANGLVLRGTADGYRPRIQPLLHEGPVRKFTKAEFDRLVDEQGKVAAVKYLLRIQGWVGDHGRALWNSGE
ncbi:hypothetical protein BJX62DRAFT_243120 [Aspergillus germanicus]